VTSIRRTLIVNLLICLVITAIFIAAANLTISIYQKRLEHMATTDSLTGLKNRHTFELIFNQAVREARRKNDPLSILIFDIDHFKKINDSLGHLVGDEVLIDVARLTTGAVREADSVYRWGGEEFLVVLPSCGLDNALKVAEKIRTAISRGKPAAMRRGITVSAGVAEFSGSESPDSLIKRADDALYRAKHAGRNRVCEG
jgi:diguanylate cyclase (GGDEF)-like protein